MILCRQLFGGLPSKSQVCEELLGYSDYQLHDFAVQHGLSKWALPDDAVLASGKCRLLVELLADLQARPAPANACDQADLICTSVAVPCSQVTASFGVQLDTASQSTPASAPASLVDATPATKTCFCLPSYSCPCNSLVLLVCQRRSRWDGLTASPVMGSGAFMPHL